MLRPYQYIVEPVSCWPAKFKTVQKQNAKRKRKQGNRSPSGFVKPTLISNELASFLNKSQGSEMARTEVTREINAYGGVADIMPNFAVFFMFMMLASVGLPGTSGFVGELCWQCSARKNIVS